MAQRLIDANELQFVEACIEPILVWDKPHWETIILKDRIDNAPTIDAEPVIRCKDCKLFNLVSDEHFCINVDKRVEENEFCCWAERRDNNGTETD